MEKKSTLGVFRNDNYRRLFSATLTSQMGREIGMSAFAFYLLERFGAQPIYTTLTQMMYSLPTLFVFFIVGVVADRMDRQKIAANSDWISAALSLTFLGAVTLGWMPLIFAILFLRSAVANFFNPAEAAMVQGVLQKDEYTTAAGLNQMVMSVFMLFGTALGLFFYRFVGIQGAILVDALAFMISGWFIRTCKMSEQVRCPNGKTTWRELNFGSVLNDFKAGIIYILQNKLLLSIILGFFLFGIVNGGFSVLFMYVTKYKLDPINYENSMVVLSMLFGISIMAGSVFATFLAKKVKLYQMLIGGILLAGALIVFAGFTPSKFTLYILVFCIGLTLGPINVAIGGWMPQIVDPKLMGRVQGWIHPLMMLAQTATLGIIAVAFPRFINVDMIFYGMGTVMLIVAVFYISALPKLETKRQQQLEHSEAVSG
ncbi:MFS transporter [Paenibacillus sp. NPDC058910]|uniref:MFS transporter n=1 Tax=unclassified Paenibacillus TaxID=185978 RepID=UPI0036AF8E48